MATLKVKRRIKRKLAKSLLLTALPDIDFSHKLITNSMRGSFMNCRLRFAYAYGRRIVRNALVIPFFVGNLVHDGLDCMYDSRKHDEERFRHKVKLATTEALKLCTDQSQSDKVWQAQAVVIGSVNSYARLFLKKDLRRWRVVETERTFGPLEIPGSDWRYTGKRDMVARKRKRSGRPFLWEHKTASQIDAGYVARLPIDDQILGYSWSMLEDEELDMPQGVVYNIIQKTKLRQKQSESFNEYLDRVEQDYTENPSKYFYREPVQISRADVHAFKRNLMKLCEELDSCVERGHFYANHGQCYAPGRGTCQYLPLCVNGTTPEQLSQYRHKESVHEELTLKEDSHA